MRVRLAARQPRSLRNERVCDHHYGLVLQYDPQATLASVPACTGPIQAIIIDFLPDAGLLACPSAIEYLRSES